MVVYEKMSVRVSRTNLKQSSKKPLKNSAKLSNPPGPRSGEYDRVDCSVWREKLGYASGFTASENTYLCTCIPTCTKGIGIFGSTRDMLTTNIETDPAVPHVFVAVRPVIRKGRLFNLVQSSGTSI